MDSDMGAKVVKQSLSNTTDDEPKTVWIGLKGHPWVKCTDWHRWPSYTLLSFERGRDGRGTGGVWQASTVWHFKALSWPLQRYHSLAGYWSAGECQPSAVDDSMALYQPRLLSNTQVKRSRKCSTLTGCPLNHHHCTVTRPLYGGVSAENVYKHANKFLKTPGDQIIFAPNPIFIPQTLKSTKFTPSLKVPILLIFGLLGRLLSQIYGKWVES